MKRYLLWAACLIATLPTLAADNLQYQQPTWLTPVPSPNQAVRGAPAFKYGAVGFALKRGSTGEFSVSYVVTGSPADQAGLKVEDLILSVNGQPLLGMQLQEAYRLFNIPVGQQVTLSYKRGEVVGSAVAVTLPKKTVYPEMAAEEQLPPALQQEIFDGKTLLTIGATPTNAGLSVWLTVTNFEGASMLQVDESKFFALDGARRQLRHYTTEELKYSVQLWAAANTRAGYYPPPPPPRQTSYTITGTETGHYTLQTFGNTGYMTGATNSTYYATPEVDYGQLGYSLGLLFRNMADKRHNKKVVEEAQETISNIERWGFHSGTMIPGENRQGNLFFSGSLPLAMPVRVVLFLTNPATGKDESFTFEFK
jgi:hypothetical protein